MKMEAKKGKILRNLKTLKKSVMLVIKLKFYGQKKMK